MNTSIIGSISRVVAGIQHGLNTLVGNSYMNSHFEYGVGSNSGGSRSDACLPDNAPLFSSSMASNISSSSSVDNSLPGSTSSLPIVETVDNPIRFVTGYLWKINKAAVANGNMKAKYTLVTTRLNFLLLLEVSRAKAAAQQTAKENK